MGVINVQLDTHFSGSDYLLFSWTNFISISCSCPVYLGLFSILQSWHSGSCRASIKRVRAHTEVEKLVGVEERWKKPWSLLSYDNHCVKKKIMFKAPVSSVCPRRGDPWHLRTHANKLGPAWKKSTWSFQMVPLDSLGTLCRSQRVKKKKINIESFQSDFWSERVGKTIEGADRVSKTAILRFAQMHNQHWSVKC